LNIERKCFKKVIFNCKQCKINIWKPWCRIFLEDF